MSKKAVVDASVVVAWLLQENIDGKISKMFENMFKEEIVVYAPKLMFYEVINAIKSAVVQNRVNSMDALDIAEKFKELKIKMLDQTNGEQILKLAIDRKISVYDASYVVAAENMGCDLISLDKRLII